MLVLWVGSGGCTIFNIIALFASARLDFYALAVPNMFTSHLRIRPFFFHVHMKCENLFSRVIFPACKMFFYCSPCCALACFSFSSKLLRHSSMAHGYLIIRGLNFSFPKMRASNWRYLVYLINYATYSRRVLFGGRKVVDKPFWFDIKFSSCQCD